MPLSEGSDCKAFWSNYKHLYSKFQSAGKDEATARKMAVAAASKKLRDAGGSPSECLKKKGD